MRYPARRDVSVHFVRAWVVRPFARFLDALGCPVEKHLQSARLSPALLEDEQNPVPLRAALAFARAASRAEGIDHLGMRVAQTLTPSDLGNLRHLLGRSRNMYAYLLGAMRFASSVSTSTRYELRIEGDEARFVQTVRDPQDPGLEHEFGLGVTVNTFRLVAPREWRPRLVVCPGNDADGLARISDALANVRTHRDARSSFFTLPLRMLIHRPPRLDRPSNADPSRDLASMTGGDFLASMRCLVESLVMGGLSDLATAAEILGMSARTLQRRLALHGVEYSRLVEEARISRAEGWLQNEDRPVADIARSLGYRDPSNFARAFRRVNGMSPRAYRALTKAKPPVAARG